MSRRFPEISMSLMDKTIRVFKLPEHSRNSSDLIGSVLKIKHVAETSTMKVLVCEVLFLNVQSTTISVNNEVVIQFDNNEEGLINNSEKRYFCILKSSYRDLTTVHHRMVGLKIRILATSSSDSRWLSPGDVYIISSANTEEGYFRFLDARNRNKFYPINGSSYEIVHNMEPRVITNIVNMTDDDDYDYDDDDDVFDSDSERSDSNEYDIRDSWDGDN